MKTPEWALPEVPTDRVVQLRNVGPGDVVRFAAYASADVPAVLIHHAMCLTSPVGFVRAALDDMEAASVSLFPAWLPGAGDIRQPGGAGVAAVRAMASALAARSTHFGPFLGDLAALALAGGPATSGRFTPEVRAAGLARVIADGFARRGMVLAVQVPDGMSGAQEHAVVAGAEWLAARGRLGVWLLGAPLTHVDWLPSGTVTGSAAAPPWPVADDVIGKPHPASVAEAALEAALGAQHWAYGRQWNQSYQSHVLTNPVRVDLLWPAERCVVEIDGPEHRDPLRFEADRQRDVQLQLDGYAVLRFTNARIKHDVHAVVRQIGEFLQTRRREILERASI